MHDIILCTLFQGKSELNCPNPGQQKLWLLFAWNFNNAIIWRLSFNLKIWIERDANCMYIKKNATVWVGNFFSIEVSILSSSFCSRILCSMLYSYPLYIKIEWLPILPGPAPRPLIGCTIVGSWSFCLPMIHFPPPYQCFGNCGFAHNIFPPTASYYICIMNGFHRSLHFTRFSDSHSSSNNISFLMLCIVFSSGLIL